MKNKVLLKHYLTLENMNLIPGFSFQIIIQCKNEEKSKEDSSPTKKMPNIMTIKEI